jgi:hypothetical protein
MAYASDANQADFFGEGSAGPVQAPSDPNDLPNPANPDGMSNNELRRRQMALQRDTGLNHQQGPVNTAPATPAAGGGPAPSSFYQPAFQARSSGIGSTTRDGSGNVVTVRGDNYLGESDQIAAKMGTVQDLGRAGGVQQLGFTPNYSADALGGAQPQVVDSSLHSAGQLADNVLGTQPTVNPQNQVNAANRDALTPVVDPNLATSPETDRALAMSQDLVNRITNAPLQTAILGDQSLSNQLAAARSARGGAGAQQDALNNAQAMAPQLQQAAAQQSIQEQVTRAGAAGQAASIYAGVATNDANRATTIATANQTAGLSVLNNLTTLTGQDLQFDAAKMGAVGQLARDYFNNAQVFANMDNVKPRSPSGKI